MVGALAVKDDPFAVPPPAPSRFVGDAPSESRSGAALLAVRAPADLVTALDRSADALRTCRPGHAISRTGVAREHLWTGLTDRRLRGRILGGRVRGRRR